MMKKRVLSLLLVLMMIVSLVPMALAEDDIVTYTVEGGDVWFSKSSGTIFACGDSVIKAVIPEVIDGILVKNIGSLAFYNCNKIQNIVLPEGLTQIQNGAFQNCTSLTSIKIPDSVTSIGKSTFVGCSNLESFMVGENNPSYSSVDDVLFDKNTKTLIAYPAGKNEKNYVVPASVDSIGSAAFYDCDGLTSVTFSGGLMRVENVAFYNCKSLTSINLPDGTTNIGNAAFSYCEELTSVIIPNSIIHIGDLAFCQCNNIKDVYYSGNETEWSKISVGTYNESLTNATIHYGYSQPHTHSYTSAVTAPTCTAAGYTTYTCSCGESYKDDYKDALGHDYKNGVCTRCKTADPDYEPSEWISFVDVPSTEYYYKPVQWAVDKGVTTGVGNNKFAPDDTCTRGQVVTFLWRAAGEPTVSADVSFTDVKAGEYYYEAVKWAVANGITTGTGNNKFSPNDTCTRGQVVTFLHRAANSPAAGSVSNFSDVQSADFYCNAVNWAVGKGITDGVGNNKFAPDDTCTRGQVVTFLYRAQ